MTHIYDWLDLPAKDENERLSKAWLNEFCKPAHLKDPKTLDAGVICCTFKGSRWICSGASRMGDVWLKRHGSDSFYDRRVAVDDCSDWTFRTCIKFEFPPTKSQVKKDRKRSGVGRIYPPLH